MLDARKAFRPDDPMRALGLKAAAPAVAPLGDAVREAIAARLLGGEAADAIVADLARHGHAVVALAAEAAAAASHPYLRAAALLQARLAKRDWLLDCGARLERQRLAHVPRRHTLPAEAFFAEHYTTLTPVVLTGLTDGWPGRQWSLERLAALGDPEIEVQWGRDGDADYELNSVAHKKRMRWREVLALLADDPETNDFYVTANNSGLNRQALDPLWREVGDLPGYLGKSHLGDGFFWMGPKGTVTPWHHDLTQNLLVNMVGVKRVSLVSPLETARMRNHRHCFSRFGADAALSIVPKSERPRVLTVDIGPGEILFLPVGWWHHVQGLTLTIGMSFTNFVWDNDFSSFYTTEGALLAK
jgi:hypothetical protein